MKRDMDLVRKILLVLEAHDCGFAPSKFSVEGFSDEQVGYHVYLMHQAALLHAKESTFYGSSSPLAIPLSITWQGYEFLANASEEKRWLQAKSLLKGAGEGSFQIWQAVLTALVTKNLGL